MRVDADRRLLVAPRAASSHAVLAEADVEVGHVARAARGRWRRRRGASATVSTTHARASAMSGELQQRRGQVVDARARRGSAAGARAPRPAAAPCARPAWLSGPKATGLPARAISRSPCDQVRRGGSWDCASRTPSISPIALLEARSRAGPTIARTSEPSTSLDERGRGARRRAVAAVGERDGAMPKQTRKRGRVADDVAQRGPRRSPARRAPA